MSKCCVEVSRPLCARGAAWGWFVSVSAVVSAPLLFLLIAKVSVIGFSGENVAYSLLYGFRWALGDSVTPFQPHSQLLFLIYGPLVALLNRLAPRLDAFLAALNGAILWLAIVRCVAAAALIYFSRHREPVLARAWYALLLVDLELHLFALPGNILSTSYQGIAPTAALCALPVWGLLLDKPQARATALIVGVYVALTVCIKLTFIAFAGPLLAYLFVANWRNVARLAEAAGAAVLVVLAVYIAYYRNISGLAEFYNGLKIISETQYSWHAIRVPFLRWLIMDGPTSLPGYLFCAYLGSLVVAVATVRIHRRYALVACHGAGFLVAAWIFAQRAYGGMYPEFGGGLLTQSVVLVRYCIAPLLAPSNRARGGRLVSALGVAAILALLPTATLGGLESFEVGYEEWLRDFSVADGRETEYISRSGTTLVIAPDNSYAVWGVADVLCKASMNIFEHSYRSEAIAKRAPDFKCLMYDDYPKFDMSGVRRVLFSAGPGEGEREAIARLEKYFPAMSGTDLKCVFRLGVLDHSLMGCDVN